MPITMKAAFAAEWERGEHLTYTIFALGEDGIVYRHDYQCGGWVAMSQEVVTHNDATHKQFAAGEQQNGHRPQTVRR